MADKKSGWRDGKDVGPAQEPLAPKFRAPKPARPSSDPVTRPWDLDRNRRTAEVKIRRRGGHAEKRSELAEADPSFLLGESRRPFSQGRYRANLG
jgi:hypothetical protein